MDRLKMPSMMANDVAERLSDIADGTVLEFNPYNREDVEAVVPYSLVEVIQQILECRGSSLEAYEEARQKLEEKLAERFQEI